MNIKKAEALASGTDHAVDPVLVIKHFARQQFGIDNLEEFLTPHHPLSGAISGIIPAPPPAPSPIPGKDW